ncbi:MAG TPA: ferredoxin family protein [Polyangia bacterium]
MRPVVDRARCEGKRDCVEVCPYGVFEVAVWTTPISRAFRFSGARIASPTVDRPPTHRPQGRGPGRFRPLKRLA